MFQAGRDIGDPKYFTSFKDVTTENSEAYHKLNK